ncbi:hypothetical protein FIV42_00615 [Persicimonas caeni]|uniref:Calcineurin-like phosphoesterase domain-containing protein n=1 Tax=Persicimonas caeni TaxID=2292766 RepID=A0A4Y6PLU7_PERCE|nr:metallophosphoesterase [Persicimonas caeni]QDG49286.1 hypothetical protein FIV42_00615 [Persicimonas caeni]QED30507.1 hypothetical protein FRD00_00610 [Persicimonas caeni]
MKLIHLSDLHVSTRDDPEYRNLQHIVDHITRHHQDAAIVITGDFVNSAKASEFEVVREALAPLAEHCRLVMTMPGNHDYKLWGNVESDGGPERFFEFREKLTKARAGYPYVMEINGVQLIALDSCMAANDTVDLARGKIGYAQRMQVADYLEMGSPHTRVVMLHHHPFYRDLGLELVDADELLATLAGRCDLLLFGHRHVSAVWSEVFGVGWIVAAGKSTRADASHLHCRVFELEAGIVNYRGNRIALDGSSV